MLQKETIMHILGLDVGGTGIKGAIVDTEKGELITERYRLLTPKPATPDAIIGTIKEIIDHFEWQGPVGCGFPAAIKHNVVKTASNIDESWIGLNASEVISKKTGCQFYMFNDVDAAGTAEVAFGAGKDVKGTVVVVAAGTGIGSALFIDGILVPNTEFGHVEVKGKNAEKYAADSVRKKKELSFKEWGKRFNHFLERLEFLLWPDLFILGGGVSKHFEKYEEHFETETPVLVAKMLNEAGIIGAAKAAERQI